MEHTRSTLKDVKVNKPVKTSIIHTSNGKIYNSGFEHNARTENQNNTGFYAFVFLLVVSACGLVAFFAPYILSVTR